MDKLGQEPCQLLPQVLQPDLTPDATAYTADMLAQLRPQASPQPSAARNPVTAAMLQYGSHAPASTSQLLNQLHDFSTADSSSLDAYAPTPAALLAGNNGYITDAADTPPESNQPATVWRQQQLDKASLQWVQDAQPQLGAHSPPPPLHGAHTGAVQNAFALPQDIRQLTTRDLIAAGASAPKHPWLVVAGWPCQDLSLAGAGAGLQAAQVERPANRTVSIALGPGRYSQQVKSADRPPRYCCNKPGEPMTAWPTFMAHPSSYAFRLGQPGSVTTSTGHLPQRCLSC